MVTMAQSAADWRNTHTHVNRTHSLMHLHQHGYNHVVRSASSAIIRVSVIHRTLTWATGLYRAYVIILVRACSVHTWVEHTDSESAQHL